LDLQTAIEVDVRRFGEGFAAGCDGKLPNVVRVGRAAYHHATIAIRHDQIANAPAGALIDSLDRSLRQVVAPILVLAHFTLSIKQASVPFVT
jgi:hypothetical protein